MQEIVLAETWRDRIEEGYARLRENRSLLMIVAAVVGFSVFLWARGPSARIAPPAQAEVAAAPAPSFSASLDPGTVIVHVAGAVRRPGLYEFPVGARIADAIETAGGALRRADLGLLNLAELLVDGAQIAVPERGSQPTTVPAPVTGSSADPSPPTVPLNSADAAALETIPGIGPVTAQAILDHRSQIGAFGSVDELLDVDGIGPATLESIRPYLTL